VEEALATGSFSGATLNYLGIETLAVAESIDIAAGQWVLVGEVSSDEAYAELRSYVNLLIILIVTLVPLLAIVAVLLSRRMLRPIDDLVSVADDVGRGRTDIASPFFGNDEFDDVSRRLNGVIDAMRSQERELEAADAETTELLLAAMPARLAEQMMSGDFSLSQELHDATIVVATVGDTSVVDAVGQDSLADRTVQIAGQLAGVARDRGVEVLHSSTTQYVFALGLDVEAPEANKAVAFASDVQETIRRLADEFDADITCRVGLSAGQVIQGIVGSDRVAFTVWGVPLDYATDLSMASAPGEILVDATVAGRLDPEWSLEPVNELVDLSGGRLDGWRVLGHALASQN
jgi:class 3 adenylate cyclase